MSRGDDEAFPRLRELRPDSPYRNDHLIPEYRYGSGLTIREWFIGQALASGRWQPDEAVRAADAVVAALNKGTEE